MSARPTIFTSCVSSATSRCAHCSTTTHRLTLGPCRSSATTSTRSPSARSTLVSSSPATFASTSSASGSSISTCASSTSAAGWRRPRLAGRWPMGSPTPSAPVRACAVANTVAYAQACEAALGVEPDRELRRCRTLLLELERVYNHLHDISAICAGVGFAPGTMAYAALKERAQRLNERLTGHRFLFGTVRVASSELALTAGDVGHARAELRAVRDEHATTWRQLQFVVSLQQRLADVGVLTSEDAERLGAVGPTARAAGLRHDVRSESPRLWYGGLSTRHAGACQRGRRQPHDPAGARARAVPRAARRAAAPPCATGPRPRRHRRGQHRDRARREPPGGRRSASSSVTATACAGCTFAPAPTRTGRCSPTQSPGICCPTSRSSTRASSSATPAWTAEPCSSCSTTSSDCDTRSPHRRQAARGSLALRHVDAGSCNGCEHELTAAGEPLLRPPAVRFEHRGLAAPRRRAAGHWCQSPRAWRRRCERPTMRCPSRASSPPSATARWAATCSGLRDELAGPLEDIVPVDLRIAGCPPAPATIAEGADRRPARPARHRAPDSRRRRRRRRRR